MSMALKLYHRKVRQERLVGACGIQPCLLAQRLTGILPGPHVQSSAPD